MEVIIFFYSGENLKNCWGGGTHMHMQRSGAVMSGVTLFVITRVAKWGRHRDGELSRIFILGDNVKRESG